MNTNYLNLVLRKPDPPSSFRTPYKENSQGSITQDTKARAPLLLSLPVLPLSGEGRKVPRFQTPSQSRVSSNGNKRPSTEELEEDSPPTPKSFKSNENESDTHNRMEETGRGPANDDSTASKGLHRKENDGDTQTSSKEETDTSSGLGIDSSKIIIEVSSTAPKGLKSNEDDSETSIKEKEETDRRSCLGIEDSEIILEESPSAPKVLKSNEKDSDTQTRTEKEETETSSSHSNEDSEIILKEGIKINENDSDSGRLVELEEVMARQDEFPLTCSTNNKMLVSNAEEKISPRGWERSVFNLSMEDLVSDYGELSDLSRKFDKLASDSNTYDIRTDEERDTIRNDGLDDDGSFDFDFETVSRADPISSWSGSTKALPQSQTSSVKSFGIANISFDEYRKSFRSYSQALWNSKTDHSASKEQHEGDVTVPTQDEILVSVFHNTAGLGAAVYHTESAKLELLRDVPEGFEEFEMLSMLLYQTEPDKILMSARQDQNTVKFVKDLFSDQESLSHNQSCVTDPGSAESPLQSQKIVLRPSREFNLKDCERRLKSINIPCKKPESDQERDILLSAFIDFNCDNMVRAAGALMNYVDKNYRHVGGDEPDVLFLGPLNLQPILSLDSATLTSLQIFSTSSQLSGSTAGSWNKRREGLSIFTLLNKCSSVVGSRFLRQMLRCPSGEKEVIERRQHDLEFFCNPAHISFTQALCASVKKIKNFPRLMKKLSSNSQLTTSDWKAIAETLKGIVEIALHAENCKEEVFFLQNILVCMSERIYSLRKVVDQLIDFKNSPGEGTPKVNPGVDAELDEKRRDLHGLPDLLTKVVLEESPKMPEFVNIFTIEYLPHHGFLVAVPSSQQLKEKVDFKNLPGLEFVFESNNTIHFRNARTRLLHTTVGDIYLDITKLETQIINNLSEAVLKKRDSLEKIVICCAHLDCLLALSHVCRDRNWVKPEITVGGDITIRDGRHPLQETSLNNFIANDTDMGSQGGRVHFLTGPNSSGKSVYMKQVGLIVFLAHLGCFVPASSASIPVLDRINTRITTTESVSTGMSSFMCDINQLTFSLTHLRTRSLLLVDEFGKGTAAKDGASLLAATVSILADLDQAAPFSIFSSHFHSVPPLVDSNLQPRFLYMKTEVKEDDLIYYFKLTDGISKFSHATKVARMAGLDNNVLERAEGILNCIINGDEIVETIDLLNKKRISEVITHLLDMKLESDDEEEVILCLQMVKDLDI